METAKDRRLLVREAGYSSTSFVSILAGTLVAFGAVALVMAGAGAVGSQLGLSTGGISTHDWRNAGIAGAAVAALVLFGSFLFGGYTAGRMSRRAGARHGLLVFLLAAVVIAVVAGLAAWLGDPSSVRDNLSSNGVPVDRNTWSDIGVGAAIAAIVAMLLGSLVGGIQGDRWHGRLVTAAAERHEAANPEVRHDAPHPLGDDPLTTGPVVDVVRAERERSVEDERYQAEIAAADLGF